MLCPGDSPWYNITCWKSVLCCVAACAFGMNIHNRWMFATSFVGLSALACICEHERSAHVDVAGKRLEDGAYLSRGTAEYPASLAAAFIQTIRHLGDLAGPQDYSLRDAIKLVPAKEMDALPVAFQDDGGGLGSSPDWSCPPQGKDNLLLALRQKWLAMLFAMGFPQRLRLRVASGADTCPLSPTRKCSSFAVLLTSLQLRKGCHQYLGTCPPDSPTA